MKTPLLTIAACLLATLAYAGTVSLNWQASTSADLVKYRIYYDNYSNGAYARFVDISSASRAHSATFTHISTNRDYCFKGTAFYRYSGNLQRESLASNRQCGKIEPHPDYTGHPNYRTSGTPNPRPDTTPNLLPVCSSCHG